MIAAILAWSARNRVLVLLGCAVAAGLGVRAALNIPLDAIPDLSDPQVIVETDWPGRSPGLVEDQLTYPIVTSLLGAPRVSAVRGTSEYGTSYVHVIFQEGTDLYWARTRVEESLARLRATLPEGVEPRLGPDASGVGWAYEYALVDRTGAHDLGQIRAFNDFTLRYWLASVPGVAEVAPVGGFTEEWHVEVDPVRLQALQVPIDRVLEAVRRSNGEAGARVLETSGRERVVRAGSWLTEPSQLMLAPLGDSKDGAPILLRDVARVVQGPGMRRGVAELDGKGEAVGGIVVVRQGANTLDVLHRVKARLAEVRPSFPAGIELVTAYDRSELIERSMHTLLRTLLEELAVVSLVILLFLRHLPSALIPIVTIPLALAMSFLPMAWSGTSANIMSLSGLAIALGALVDAAIVAVEQTHARLERWQAQGRPGPAQDVVLSAIREVAGPSFFSLLVIAVSFVPVLALQAQEGRLFRPLALTKTAAMAVAALLAVTLDPALRLLVTRVEPFTFRPKVLSALATRLFAGSLRHEEKSRTSRVLQGIYAPALRACLDHPAFVAAGALLLGALALESWRTLGSEFMPPLNEGSILAMPMTLPGLSVTEAQRALSTQDALIAQVPEVERVFGKIGRADTATDPAPLNMVETTLTLKPESEWRTVHVRRFWTDRAPGFAVPLLRWLWPDVRRLTWDELIADLDARVRLPAFANAWLFPVRTRIDMNTTGVRTPVGIEILGPDLETIAAVGTRVEAAVRRIPGTRTAFFDRVSEGGYVNIDVDRERAARLGLSALDVDEAVATSVGGMEATTLVDGRERHAVVVRLARDTRSTLPDLAQVPIATPSGAQVALSEVATLRLAEGPSMIRDEEGFRAGIVHVDVADRDLGSWIEEARQAVEAHVTLPPGTRLRWSGQYEWMQRARARLLLIVPFTLALIALLLWLNTRSAFATCVILLAVPFSAIGAILLLHALHYHLSVAVGVGLIALMGVDAETGVFMLLYLDLAWRHARDEGRMRTPADLREAILEGAVRRLRPKVMTVSVMFVGLVPILWSTGTGSDVMRRIAAPMVGGLATSFVLELLIYPVLYEAWKRRALPPA